ncbi:MAG: creatininase family protein [Verrucomicrobiota bacterium]
MLDATKTTFDWQANPTDVCVLPVSSVEQHGAHLPVLTDVILGDYFGRLIAEGLNAALLPTLPYGTCLEHTAFRGSFTLRPETLMQVVRDLADAAEQQSFKFLVLVNSHGGNFCIPPVARDINRHNRPLKILFVNWWEFCDPAVSIEGVSNGKEIHAGAWETSLLMVIRPDLVGTDFRNLTVDPHDLLPLDRRDLTTFGSGRLNPDGALGFPSKAKREIGQTAIDSIRKNIFPYLRDRIARLRQDPRY